MEIVHDSIIYSLQRAGGISAYWSQIGGRLPVSMNLIFTRHKENIFYKPGPVDNKLKSRVMERYQDVQYLNPQKHIFHSSYYRISNLSSAINITTVHDFIYEKYRTDMVSLIHKHQKRRSINRSKGVILISENTKKDFLEYFPNYSGLIKVIYNGKSDEYKIIPGVKKEKSVVFVGDRRGYKNFKILLEAMTRHRDKRLVVVGGGAFTKEEKKRIDAYKLLNNVEHKTAIPNSELNLIYNKSLCLVYPSDYEGFGLPIIEAMAAGCPVVCSSGSSTGEVAGKAAITLKEINHLELANAITYLENAHTENLRLCGLENAKKYNWGSTAIQTEEFYSEVYKKACLDDKWLS